jgi:polysaccharide biosynthesis protein PelF
MRVCIVAEGCYPFVVGGVSSWVNSLIQLFPNTEFVILAIAANRSQRGNYVYELPDNVTEVHELYLDDVDWCKQRRRRHKLKKEQYYALRSLVLDQQIAWDVLFDMMQQEDISVNDLLMGEDFLHAVTDCYRLQYSQIVFSDFLWTMRSIYLPLLLTLKMKIPKADLYHCVATGYAGVLGSMAKHLYGSRMLISEHGIYTREREEELIKAKWVSGIYKNIWIAQFRKMSRLAYEQGQLITSLFEHARELQIELDCPEEKTMVTPNGIRVEHFCNLPGKTQEDEGMINIGAVLRVTPIKDVKTMIQAFGFAKEKDKRLKLWIMGPCEEDEEYARECFELVESLHISDIVFTGRIDVREYLGRMDMTILTSISEGQPLTILEGFAAKKPAIATDVGNCYGLIYGETDDFGPAGIITHIMNVEEIAQAMLDMAENEEMRLKMGENGYKRVMKKYRVEYMQKQYWEIYRDYAESMGLLWKEKPVELPKTDIKEIDIQD